MVGRHVGRKSKSNENLQERLRETSPLDSHRHRRSSIAFLRNTILGDPTGIPTQQARYLRRYSRSLQLRLLRKLRCHHRRVIFSSSLSLDLIHLRPPTAGLSLLSICLLSDVGWIIDLEVIDPCSSCSTSLMQLHWSYADSFIIHLILLKYYLGNGDAEPSEFEDETNYILIAV